MPAVTDDEAAARAAEDRQDAELVRVAAYTGLRRGTRKVTEPQVVRAAQLLLDLQEYYNDGFQAVSSGTFGNEQRNQFRGPRWQSFDMSLARTFRINTRFGATVRWDVFNLFNTTNFGLPNRNVSDAGTFGTITSLAGDPRITQLAVRLTF